MEIVVDGGGLKGGGLRDSDMAGGVIKGKADRSRGGLQVRGDGRCGWGGEGVLRRRRLLLSIVVVWLACELVRGLRRGVSGLQAELTRE